MTPDEEMTLAVKNVGHDPQQLAHYLYERCCEFMIDHQGKSEALMAAMIRALKQ